MTQVVLPHRPVTGDPEDVSEIMADLDAILAVVNGDLKDDNIAVAANILVAKLAAGANGDRLEMVDTVPTWVKQAKGKGRRVGGQSIAHATATRIVFTEEVYDNDSMLDVAGANPGRFTPHTPGLYSVVGTGVWSFPGATGGSGNTRMLSVHLNGAAFVSVQDQGAVGPDAQQQNVVTHLPLNGLTDYLELYAYQVCTGGAANISSCSLSVVRMCA
jgi:hypothetical protein